MCGIFGIWDAPQNGDSNMAAQVTRIGLHGNQNRAHDYAGIVSTDGLHLYRHASAGIAKDVFTPARLKFLRGMSALGHVRYPTVSDEPGRDNMQPIEGNWKGQPFALAHNGSLTNTQSLAKRFPHQATSMDSEYIVRLIEQSDAGNIESAIVEALEQLKGSFELGILLQDRLIAVRDPQGNHPLSVGRLGSGYVISSETTAFGMMRVTEHWEVAPGTMVIIDGGTVKTARYAKACEKKCSFEYVYVSMPSSEIAGTSVSEFRLALGRKLEELCPAQGADIVAGVPDSSSPIALGYGESGRSGRYRSALLRHHYAGRNFLIKNQEGRDDDIAMKHPPDVAAIRGKKIVLVEDSIVRGTTLRHLVGLLRDLNAKEIHLRIGCPPISHPCLYGINTRTRDELIINRLGVEKLCAFLQADSLEFLPIEAFQELIPGAPSTNCFACMNGEYWHEEVA